MEKDKTSFLCVLRTGKLHEHTLAVNVLKENNVPFHMELETSTGLRLAMPFQPSMAPGTFYSILVPEDVASSARNILNALPIDATTEPDVWHFGASEGIKKVVRVFVWAILGGSLLLLIAQVFK